VEWSDTMNVEPSLAVTLSVELFELLSAEARKLGLPLEWLVASLVVDTVEEDAMSPALACCA
jgi:hypothetical protein